MNAQHKPLGLDDITCIAAADGMARRVLDDVEKAHLSQGELQKAYLADLQLLGSRYDNLIRLGNFLDSLNKSSCK